MRHVCTLLVVISLLFTTLVFGQVKEFNAGGFKFQLSSVDTTLNNAFCSVGQMPEFPGGTKKLVAFAKSKIRYPKSAVNDNIQGNVVLRFVIDKKGKVINKLVFKGVRYDIDTVCLKMLNQMPNWKPAYLNGKALAVNLRWTIIFMLTD